MTHKVEFNKVMSQTKTSSYEIFLDQDIEDVAYYRGVISALGSAGPDDIIYMYLSTDGGFCATTSSITHAMDNCPAHIVGIIAGDCMSSGTIIALHCDSWEIGANASWMAHTASFSVRGSAEKAKGWHDHEQELNIALMHREYTGFYTVEEIEEILAGKESFLTKHAIEKRLVSFVQHNKDVEAARLEVVRQDELDTEHKRVTGLFANFDVTVSEVEAFNRLTLMINNADSTVNRGEL